MKAFLTLFLLSFPLVYGADDNKTKINHELELNMEKTAIESAENLNNDSDKGIRDYLYGKMIAYQQCWLFINTMEAENN